MKCAVSGLVLIDPDIETAPAAPASNQSFFSLLCPPPPAPCNGEGLTARGASHPGGGQSSTLGPGRLPVLVELLVQGCGIGKPRFRSQRAHRRPCGSRAPALPLKTRGPRLMEQGKAGSQRHF